MANNKTNIDEWEVRDLEDNSLVTVAVIHNTEMGNQSLPGIQVVCAGQIVNYEPLHAARWAWQAAKANKAVYIIEDASWQVYEDRYIRHSLVTGDQPKARIEVKVRSSTKPVVKEYDLPFIIEQP